MDLMSTIVKPELDFIKAPWVDDPDHPGHILVTDRLGSERGIDRWMIRIEPAPRGRSVALVTEFARILPRRQRAVRTLLEEWERARHQMNWSLNLNSLALEQNEFPMRWFLDHDIIVASRIVPLPRGRAARPTLRFALFELSSELSLRWMDVERDAREAVPLMALPERPVPNGLLKTIPADEQRSTGHPPDSVFLKQVRSRLTSQPLRRPPSTRSATPLHRKDG